MLNNAVFRKNLATGGRGLSTAGAVWIGFTKFNITESKFIANVAQSSGTDCTSSLQRDNAWGVGAGALYMQTCVGSILGTRFESNVVTGGKVFTVGAALWAQADVDVVLGGSLFLQNKMQMGSQDDGGVSSGCMGGGPDYLTPFCSRKLSQIVSAPPRLYWKGVGKAHYKVSYSSTRARMRVICSDGLTCRPTAKCRCGGHTRQ